MSLLSLGDLGWIQILSFVLSGSLYMVYAIGLQRRLRPGRGSTWAPILIGLNGIGLIIAGVFVTDAGAGFPPGAPQGAPDFSWHGIVHEMGFGIATLSWIVACIVLARRFASDGRRGWVALCVVALVLNIGVSAWPDLTSLSLRLVLGTAISFGFVAAVALRLLRDDPGESEYSPKSSALAAP